jgi:phosphatidylglycerol---prolipoprotein diacylglyceryl transferase
VFRNPPRARRVDRTMSARAASFQRGRSTLGSLAVHRALIGIVFSALCVLPSSAAEDPPTASTTARVQFSAPDDSAQASSTDGFYVHHLSPFAIEFTPGVGIRWYGLAYLAGLGWGCWMLWRWSRRGRAPFANFNDIQDFVLFAGIGMIIGGRLGYCLLYAWPDVVDNPFGRIALYDQTVGMFIPDGAVVPTGHAAEKRVEFPFVLQVWNGGMASHGGLAGLIVGSWLFARRRRRSLLVLLDVVAATTPLGVALGRIANFINGELWGRPSTVPWAVIFPDAPLVNGHQVPRHPSQLYAAGLEGLLALAIVLPLHARHRRPGLTTGALLCVYAVGRFVDECFREPDFGQPGSPGHEAILGFMSKGQVFTVPLFIAGVILSAWALRRPPRPEAYQAPAPLPLPDSTAHAR